VAPRAIESIPAGLGSSTRFFTTRKIGKRTGQGLAIARAVSPQRVRRCEAVGLGTTFTIALSTNGVHDAGIQSTALRVAPG
jgi:hypothetical protein